MSAPQQNDQYDHAYRVLYEANEQSDDAVKAVMYAEASAHFLGFLADKVQTLTQQIENVQSSLSSIDAKTRIG
ncbi:hypothetical protein [Candidatus Solirubrobacter pratensis]|uniref:hypothetical protein n=1 Tax=Candidatus Solirubrobacter pratensis TaxID=1298857 RepID=UPI0003FB5F50|nr:hypothetical protein [Candidatus Solirubrobacter pratensis]